MQESSGMAFWQCEQASAEERMIQGYLVLLGKCLLLNDINVTHI